MKTLIGLLIICLFSKLATSQQKDFEGAVYYKAEVKSKSAGVSDKMMKTYLATGDNMVAYIKNGNYLQSAGASDAYFIRAKQKVFYKFKNIDTLYYLDYSYDTNTVTNISRLQGQQTVAGFPCNSISIQSGATSRKYLYSSQFHLNPEYDKGNKMAGYETYVKETESVWLVLQEETEAYSISQTATKVEAKAIDDKVFELPDLPQKLFTIETVSKLPEYPRSGGWAKYLMTNTNNGVAAKYLKIPKGENGAKQSVLVNFLITENGEVQNVKVENLKEVHPKLAEEAVRVVTESGRWKPATIYGEKVPNYLRQYITFQVTK